MCVFRLVIINFRQLFKLMFKTDKLFFMPFIIINIPFCMSSVEIIRITRMAVYETLLMPGLMLQIKLYFSILKNNLQ